MTPLRHRERIVGGALALSLVLAACTDDGTPSGDGTSSPDASGSPASASDDTSASPAPSATASDGSTGAGGPDSGASTLRATLTATLQEHVYLAGTAANEALANGQNSPGYEAANQALDANARDLARLIGSLYGEETGGTFLSLWRTHLESLAEFTVARASGDAGAAEEAVAAMDAFRGDVGALLGGVNPHLSERTVQQELAPHVETMLAVIDAFAGDGADPFMALADAATVATGTASTLAVGIAAQFPDDHDGAADGSGATLRSVLTAGLHEHVHVVGLAAVVGARHGLDSDAFSVAADALDANAVALAETVRAVYGQEVQDAFLSSWRDHVQSLLDFMAARVDDDHAAAQSARRAMTRHLRQVAALLGDANPDLDAEVIAEALGPYANRTVAAINAVLLGDEGAFTAVREAAAVMPDIAAVLSDGIAEQFPDQFAR